MYKANHFFLSICSDSNHILAFMLSELTSARLQADIKLPLLVLRGMVCWRARWAALTDINFDWHIICFPGPPWTAFDGFMWYGNSGDSSSTRTEWQQKRAWKSRSGDWMKRSEVDGRGSSRNFQRVAEEARAVVFCLAVSSGERRLWRLLWREMGYVWLLSCHMTAVSEVSAAAGVAQ